MKMKKFIIGLIGIVFAFAMTFNLSSCSKEEVEPKKETSQIVGVWKKGSGRTIIKFKDDELDIPNIMATSNGLHIHSIAKPMLSL